MNELQKLQAIEQGLREMQDQLGNLAGACTTLCLEGLSKRLGTLSLQAGKNTVELDGVTRRFTHEFLEARRRRQTNQQSLEAGIQDVNRALLQSTLLYPRLNPPEQTDLHALQDDLNRALGHLQLLRQGGTP